MVPQAAPAPDPVVVPSETQLSPSMVTGSPEPDNRTADDFFDPPEPKQVFKDAPPKDSLPPVPASVKGGAVAIFKSSFFGRWYYERKIVKETGVTTRQRIKRYNAMHDGESDTDTTTPSGKVSTAHDKTSS